MEIKGTAVKSIPEFIKQNHADKYDDWLNTLPPGSKEIFLKPILPSSWYSLSDGGIAPTEVMGTVIYDGKLKEAAWQSGRYSAETSLTGLYKFFIMAASPSFIIGRAGKVFSTYYTPSRIEVADKSDKSVTLHIMQFDQANEVIENRIGGWIERALELSGAREVKVVISMSLTRGDAVTEFSISWK